MTNINVAIPEKLLAPVVELNQLALAKTEKLVDLQVAAVRKYAAMALGNWKQALQVKDLAGAQKYAAGQNDVVKQVMEDIAQDAKAMAELGKEYAAEVQKLISVPAKGSKKAA